VRFDEFKPQLAKGAVSVAAVASKSAMEPKLDGWRLLAHVDEDGVHLYSRSGKSYDGSLPHLEAELGERFPAGTVLDGEALAAEIGEGQVIHRWGTVQSVLGSSGTHPEHERVSFVVFDLLAHGGLDARPLPYTQRRALLEQIFEDEYATMQLVEQLPATEDAYETLVARGYEGAVVKRLDSRYSSGARGAGWSKVKPSETTDAFVVGFEEGTNGRTGSLVPCAWRGSRAARSSRSGPAAPALATSLSGGSTPTVRAGSTESSRSSSWAAPAARVGAR